MTTNNLDAILNYPMHLQGAAWLFAQEHGGKLPSVAQLVNLFGTESRVGRLDVSAHSVDNLRYFGKLPTMSENHETQCDIEHDENVVSSYSEAESFQRWETFNAMRAGLGRELYGLLRDGHTQAEAARLSGIPLRTIERRIAAVRGQLAWYREYL